MFTQQHEILIQQELFGTIESKCKTISTCRYLFEACKFSEAYVFSMLSLDFYYHALYSMFIFYFIEVITLFIEVYFMYFSASLDSHNIGVNPFPQGYKSTKPRN